MQTRKKYIDPTYLRTIHDGLLSGVVHKDNASALPLGLVGMYEEAMPSASNVKERNRFLEFFGVWALLKKEVRADFVVPLLDGWTEEEVLNYISKYSKWFNSPVSGKYVLYHERFRIFILLRINLITEINKRLLGIICAQAEINEINKEEYNIYLENYYGDHLALSAYYKTENDNNYLLLKELNITIVKNKWNVNPIDRMRWNLNASILACVDIDETFLEEIIISQDLLLNSKIDLEYYFNKIINNKYDEFDKYYLYSTNDLEKGLASLHLMHSVIYFIENAMISNYLENSNDLAKTLIGLTKKVNDVIGANYWIAPEDYLIYLNNRISSITSNLNTVIEPLIIPQPHGDIISDIKFRPPFKTSDLDLFASDFIEQCNDNNNNIHQNIKNHLLGIINEAIKPTYTGDVDDINEIILLVENLSWDASDGYGLIINIVMRFKDMIAYTENADSRYDYNYYIDYLVRDCILSGIECNNLNWVDCYIDSIEYLDTVMHYQVLNNVLNSKLIDKGLLFNTLWKDKHSFLASAISASQILYCKGNTKIGADLYERSLVYFINYPQTSEMVLRLGNYLQQKEYLLEDFVEVENIFKKKQYLHIPTLSYILCRKYGFLDLATFLWHDSAYLTGVRENKLWAHDIIKGIVHSLGSDDSYKYLLAGLDQYIAVMGSYQAEEYDREANRPASNTWKLEWWVISNFVVEYQEYMNEITTDMIFDYAGYEKLNKSNINTNFDDRDYYDSIEAYFEKYGFSPDGNLYYSIDLWSDQPRLGREENIEDRIFNISIDNTKTLLSIQKYFKNKDIINNYTQFILSVRNKYRE